MEAVAKHSFERSDSDELSFCQGDRLIILNYGAPNNKESWFYAIDQNNQKGYVPCNYIDISTPDWFHRRIPRISAHKKLESSPIEGAFLVRMSESYPGEFSLSVKCRDSVQHFRIIKNERDRFLLWKDHQDFSSIQELVDHYRHQTLTTSNLIFLRDMLDDNHFFAQAKYDFEPTAQSDDDAQELGFRKGEWITVFDASDKNWWAGMIGDRKGFFPAEYVVRDNPDEQRAPEYPTPSE